MRFSRYIFRTEDGINPFRLGSASIVLRLTVQVTGVLLLGLAGVGLWTIAQMDHHMTVTETMQAGVLWHLGMENFVLAMVVAMPVLAGVILLLVWRSLQPLRQLNQFAATNPFDQETQIDFVSEKTPLEIRALSQTFSTLASSLSNTGIQQQQFIGSLSHELRTSLSLISGYLQHVLRHSSGLTQNQQEALEIATAETEHMVQILHDSLELARAENYALPFQLELLVLNEVVANAVKLTERFRHQVVQVNASSPHILVKADRNRLLQVIIHLIDNAIRRCKDEQTIVLQLEQTPDSALIQISDRGYGIAISQTSQQPVALSDVRSRENIDLGLAIVDTLVRRMGGDVSVQSFPGQGSNFWVRLPIE